MSLATTRTHTDAVLTALATTGKPVGDGQTPSDSTCPYVVVDRMGGATDGDLADPDDHVVLTVQVRSVGLDREGAEWMRDTVRSVLIGNGTLTVAGRSVLRVTLDADGGVRRDDALPEPLFYAVDRFRIWTVPS